MYSATCILTVLALTAHIAYSWDYAMTCGNNIEFYTNSTPSKAMSDDGIHFNELTALAYDAVHNMLLFVDSQNDNTSIFSYDIMAKKYGHLVQKKSLESIQGLAYDPVTGLLFWTDYKERSIYSMSLRNGTDNNHRGKLLLKMDDEMPRAIAVDSCRGYIYWTNTNSTKATIERAQFDGSHREIIVQDSLFKPVSISIDQYTKKLYWADDSEGIHFQIESSDLDGKNRQLLLRDQYHEPNSLTVSKDYVYWIEYGYRGVWRMPKNKSSEPEQVLTFNNSPFPFGIVANFGISDQIANAECTALNNLARNETAAKETFVTPTKVMDEGIYCLHGQLYVDAKGFRRCNCTSGYVGERCEISVCHNYCLQGDCSTSAEGQPICSCKPGYSGSRCETSHCSGFCLNQGTCSIDPRTETPVCQCLSDYEGERCERDKPVVLTAKASQDDKFTASNLTLLQSTDSNLSCDSWDPVRDPILMTLGVVSGLLCILSAVLATKAMRFKPRPRITKRIIVKKNVTPLTARPDQCEITIENCCNMNICETPCFEPRSTIRPTLLDAKPGKEEKRNLIDDMEQEDY